MICPKCGVELPEGSTFCTTCGAQLAQQAAPQAAPAPAAGGIDFNGVINDIKGANGDKKPMFVAILAALHLLQLIFWFVGGISVTVKAFGQKQSESASIHKALSEDDKGILSWLVIILLVAGLALAIIRLLKIKLGTFDVVKFQPIASLVVSAAAFVVYFIQFFSLKADIPSELKDFATVGFAFGGIVLLLLCIGAAFLGFKMMKDAKAAPKA